MLKLTSHCIAAIAIAVSSTGCVAQPSAVPVTPSTVTTTPDCTDVYLLDPMKFIGPSHDPMREISVSVDGQPFEVKGKLFNRDWGAFKACGSSVTLKFRHIVDGFSVKGPFIHERADKPILSLQGRKAVYFEMGSKWAEVSEERALKVKAEIDAKPGAPTVTGWEWKDRRELYYSKDCQVKSERCP
jgi:hypothetical protein